MMTAPGWRVTPMRIDGVSILQVEEVTAAGVYLPSGRGSGRCTTVEQVRAIIGDDAFARLA